MNRNFFYLVFFYTIKISIFNLVFIDKFIKFKYRIEIILIFILNVDESR